MYILGLSAFYHDSAACLLKDGEIVAAVQEERFTRIKHDDSFPQHAVQYCLRAAGIEASDVRYVVFYEKPFLKFERLLETYLAFAPRGFLSFAKAMPVWIKEKLFQKSILLRALQSTLSDEVDWRNRLLFSEHHLSHAASAFYPSPFDKAAILTLDGVGEWATSSLAIGDGNNISTLSEIHFPHSLGLLYSAFTQYTGFRVNSGEYKLMGLAPYGVPIFADVIRERLISVADDGSFSLDMSYFNFATGLTMTSKKFHELFGGPPREPEAEITEREMNIAASIQKVTEDIVIALAKDISEKTGQRNLCLAGGVALNSVANGVLLRSNLFDEIWIQPAAGDAGGALGAALSAWHLYLQNKRGTTHEPDAMKGSYLGPEFSEEEIETELSSCGAVFKHYSQSAVIEKIAASLSKGKAIGWMQGRMEFGPRALGARSIIADPRSPAMQRLLNLKVKYRESFRPFAPSVLREDASEWFEDDWDSPYMLLVTHIRKDKRRKMTKAEESLFGIEKLNIPKSSVPAITHVNYSARVQTVHADTNPLYHALIKKFKDITGVPMVVNTSFNVRGEPIVCSPTDAFKCFMGTDLDVLAVGNFVLFKEQQDAALKEDYESRYKLD